MTAALILAGNTPLMSWSPLCACLLAGWSVFVKMSRDETLWPRLFLESLAEADGEVAARVHLDVWPGEDERTAALCRAADSVIAYGSDATINALRDPPPKGTPFFGFGHSLSVGLALGGVFAFDVARDTLLFGQSGCLSLQALFYSSRPDNWPPLDSRSMEKLIRQAFAIQACFMDVPDVTDPAAARLIREARDMALFSGAKVIADDKLRWTVIIHLKPHPMGVPPGHNILPIIPIDDIAVDFGTLLGEMRGRISSVGIAGGLSEGAWAAIRAEGVSRICFVGEMQAPPLDWPNGNVDLLTELVRIGQSVAERR